MTDSKRKDERFSTLVLDHRRLDEGRTRQRRRAIHVLRDRLIPEICQYSLRTRGGRLCLRRVRERGPCG